jgi:hypothetical protein
MGLDMSFFLPPGLAQCDTDVRRLLSLQAAVNALPEERQQRLEHLFRTWRVIHAVDPITLAENAYKHMERLP